MKNFENAEKLTRQDQTEHSTNHTNVLTNKLNRQML